MSPELLTPSAPPSALQSRHVYALAVICLVAGLAIGFVCLGTGASVATNSPSSAAPAPRDTSGQAHPVSLEDMKHMADQQAAPLLLHLNSNPANPATLGQLGAIYHLAHQYKEAADWYNRAVEAAPNDLGLRTKLAISLYRAGDVDGAINQLDECLRLNPKDPNCLFNLGMIRLQGKGDAKGALAAWRRLLKSNPDLSPERKLAVQKLIAHVTASRNGMQSQGETLDGRQ